MTFLTMKPPQNLLTPLAARLIRRVQLRIQKAKTMKVRSSLKSLKGRHRDCQIVRRKGRLYVINKTDPRFKARQG